MEKLLNELLKRWWKPFNVNCAWTNVEVINRLRDNQYLPEHSKIIFKTENHWHVFDCNIRDLVSKSSWLRQFCVENKLVPIMCTEEWIKHYYEDIDDDDLISWEEIQPTTEYEYRIIECVLRKEQELEQFLLENIIIKKWN